MTMSFENIPEGNIGVLPFPTREPVGPPDGPPSTQQQVPLPSSPAVTPQVDHISEHAEGRMYNSALTGHTFPQRWWTAGPGSPQERLYRGDRVPKLVPMYYAYIIEDQSALDVLLKNMEGRVFPEDLQDWEQDVVCNRDDCGFHCRSRQAMLRHIETCHPTGQSSAPLM
jgi:hypothetical protein